MPILHLNKLHGCLSTALLRLWAHLRGLGYRICVSLEQVVGSVPLQKFSVEPGQACAIIAGHEVKGNDQEVVDAADCCDRDTTVRGQISLEKCVGQRGNHPLASLQSYESFKRLSKIHITSLLCFLRVLSASFLFILRSCSYGYLLITKQKSIRQSFSKIGII